jgi:hypothetical protein
MKKISEVGKIREQLKRLNEAKVEAMASLQKIEADMEVIRVNFGSAIAAGKAAEGVTDQLDKAQKARERAQLILAAVDGQVTETKKKLEEAFDLEYEADLAARRAEVKVKLLELVKTIEAAHNLSAEIVGMRRRYDGMLYDRYDRRGLSYMGIPVDDILQRAHYWLGASAVSNRDMRDLLSEAGISSAVKRKNYVKKMMQYDKDKVTE